MPHPVIVIGAGPVGLAAAAHLLERHQDVIVLEAGPAAGHTIREWAHVRIFSDWRSVIDPAAGRRLSETGWSEPTLGEIPTGGDVVRNYLEPLAATLSDHVRFDHRVIAVARHDIDKLVTDGRDLRPFIVRIETPLGTEELVASAVVDASGTWMNHNPLGSSGLPAPGEASATRLRYGMPDVLGGERSRYAGKRVLVVGAGHSAANALLDLTELALGEPDTVPIWAIRRPGADRTYGGLENDELPGRGKLGLELRHRVDDGRIELVADFKTSQLMESADGVAVSGTAADGSTRTIVVDEVIATTGQRPDLAMTRELRLDLDPWLEAPRALAPLIDPNLHSCGTVPPHGVDELSHPESGFYTVGVKSYGRAPTFLMATGYEQVRSVAAAIAGDWEAARTVELELPESGVCGVATPIALGDGPANSQTQSACC
jgi:hypothetical protein